MFCPPTITRKRGSHEAVSSRAVSQVSRSRVSAGSFGLEEEDRADKGKERQGGGAHVGVAIRKRGEGSQGYRQERRVHVRLPVGVRWPGELHLKAVLRGEVVQLATVALSHERGAGG